MNCPKCNAEISENAKFCSNCGTKIEAEATIIDEQKTVEEKKDSCTPQIEETTDIEQSKPKSTDSQDKPNNKKRNRLIAIVVGCILVVGAVVALAISSQPNNSNVSEIYFGDKYLPDEYYDVIISDELELQPLFSPADETAKVKYSSDNNSIAKVNRHGIVTGVSEGSAVITAKVTDEVFTTIKICVLEDTPYNRLSENERVVVDLVSKIAYQFKNPNSINITAVSKAFTSEDYAATEVCISAQNSFGAYVTSYYLITDSDGKLEVTNMDDLFTSGLMSFTPDDSFNIDAINEVLQSK